MKTLAVIRATVADPLHLKPHAELQHVYISSGSRWGDETWLFDHFSDGSRQRQVVVCWAFELPDGSSLTDPQHAGLLDALKRFLWSLLSAPGDNAAPLAVTSLRTVLSGLRTFVSWMIENGFQHFGQLDQQALDGFKDDLPSILAGNGRVGSIDDIDDHSEESLDADENIHRGIGYSQAFYRLRIPCLLWRQRKALAGAGLATVASSPWDPYELAAAVADKAEGQIMPLPAEVAIPILNSAYRMLGLPADDVIEVTKRYFAGYDRGGTGGFGQAPGESHNVRYKQAARELADFKFSTLEGEDSPWRLPLGSEPISTLWSEPFNSTLGHEIRDLIASVRNACSIVVQSTTGMRASELLSILAGTDPLTGLPLSVETRPALSGLYEVFFIKALLTKTEATPRQEEWVLGMRVAGSKEIPPAVKALQILDRLLAPFRESLGPNAPLLVWFTWGHGLTRDPSKIEPISNATLSRGLKDFVMRNVDLSALPDTSTRALEAGDLVPYRKSRGKCIRPHQWRKTLAHFVFNTDNRLLPALSMQFKHISLAMTADAYLGRNQVVFQSLDSARAQETATLLFNMANGRSLVAGRMGQHLQEHIGELRDAITELPPSAGWKKALSFVVDKGIRLWFAPHGKCMPLSPAEMRCHQSAGTAHWLNKQPNYSVREPSLCAGCACFVLDERHADFWKERYIKSWASWKRAERDGRGRDFTIILERANQARALLTRLGIDTEELENEHLEESRVHA